MSEERDYTKDCRVNRFKLDTVTEEQSSLYQYWSEKEGDAKVSVDAADDFLKVTEAEVELELREKAINNKGNLDSGIKATADAIKAAIIIDTRVRKARRDVLKAKEDHAIYKAAKGGMEHRKSSIDNLTKLWCAGYYQDPSHPRSGTDEAANQARKNLNKKERNNG